MLEIHMKLCMTEQDVLKKNFFTPKLAGNGPKIGFFKFIEKFSLSFFSKFVP